MASSQASAVVADSAHQLAGGAFPVMPVADPAAFSSLHFHGYQGDTSGDARGLQFSKGTTTLAFKFQGGVVVSVDSRSTQGSYIGARAAEWEGVCGWGGGRGRAFARAPPPPSAAAPPRAPRHARPPRAPRSLTRNHPNVPTHPSTHPFFVGRAQPRRA